MPYFSSPEGDISEIYLSDTDILERYVGNQLWSFGRNALGQLGDNTTTSRSSPVQTISGGTNWKQVACGQEHTAAIKTDGSLWLWGYNNKGQLGDNSITQRSSPIQTLSGGTNWKQVSCGYLFTAAIKTDGTLWLWGDNASGQLGYDTISKPNRSEPSQILTGGTNWKQISCGQYHTAAIKTDGTLWLWGYNLDGRLGNNDNFGKLSPVQTISGGTNWKQVACGDNHTLAIKTDGTLWAWGDNSDGQLGDNTRVSKSSPVQTIAGGTNWKYVACGSYHTAAIKTDGTLWTWGYNLYGQLGDNTITHRSSPIQTVSGGTNWKQVFNSIGNFHTAAIKTDGTLWAWGSNGFGQLGDNTQTNRSSPIQTIAGGTNWKQVSCSYYHTIAVTYTES